jgi:hypothetical protein
VFASWAVNFIDWIVIRELIKTRKLDQKNFHHWIIHSIFNQIRKTFGWWFPNWRKIHSTYAMEFVLATPIVITLVFLL